MPHCFNTSCLEVEKMIQAIFLCQYYDWWVAIAWISQYYHVGINWFLLHLSSSSTECESIQVDLVSLKIGAYSASGQCLNQWLHVIPETRKKAYLNGRSFFFITSLYQLCQSLVIIECHILMLYHNCITLIYFIALYVLFVFYVQRWRTLRFGAI